MANGTKIGNNFTFHLTDRDVRVLWQALRSYQKFGNDPNVVGIITDEEIENLQIILGRASCGHPHTGGNYVQLSTVPVVTQERTLLVRKLYVEKVNKMNKEEFLEECGDVIGIHSEHIKQPGIYTKINRETGELYKPMTGHTRWSHRIKGNGRFEGLGMIRVFSKTCIQVQFRKPSINKVFNSQIEVINLLKRKFENEALTNKGAK